MKNFNTVPGARARKAGHALLFILLGFLFSNTAFAQVSSDLPDANNYTGVVWKSTQDLTTTFSAEHNHTALVLATPNLQAPDKAIYAAYDRLLTYLENDLPGSTSLPDIAVKDFKKVVDEAPSDPVLKYLHEGIFRQHFDWLMENLAEPAKPH